MRRKTNRLTPKSLKKMILKEIAELQKEALSGKVEDISKVKASEYKAGDEAKQLEKDIDHIKALKIHEARLIRKVKQIREARKKLKSRINKQL